MIKDILRKAKIGTVAIITALFCMIAPQLLNVRAAVEGGTDILLKMQKKTIDIDDIPDDRIVNLDISIENNTKIDVIGFIIEKDSRLEFSGYDIFQGVHGGISGSSHAPFDNQNVIFNKVFFGEYPNEDNGVFGQIKIKLPDKSNINVGDCYQVKFLSSYEYAKPCIGLLVPETSMLEGSEYFGDFQNFGDGEILITDDKPAVEPVHNDPEPQSDPVAPSDNLEQDQNNGASGQNNNNSNNTETLVPNTVINQTTPALTSSVTTVKVTKATSVSTSVSTEYMATKTEISTQIYKTDEVISVSSKTDKKSGSKLVIYVTAIIVVLASVSAVAIKNKKRREKDEK